VLAAYYELCFSSQQELLDASLAHLRARGGEREPTHCFCIEIIYSYYQLNKNVLKFRVRLLFLIIRLLSMPTASVT
jgi:hypothetical protein